MSEANKPVSQPPTTVPKPGWSIPAPCARNSAKHPRRCSSPRVLSTTPPSNARRGSRARKPGSSIRAFPIPRLDVRAPHDRARGRRGGRATATGMAAVTTAILAPLKAGDHVVAAKAMFGSCRYVVEDLLPRYGITSTLVDGLDLDSGKRRCGRTPKAAFWKARPTRSIQMVLSDPGPTVLLRLIAVAATRQPTASRIFRQPTGPLRCGGTGLSAASPL